MVGRFTTVNGVTRNRVAAFTIATGALTSFNPNVNSTVLGAAATATTLYIGGNFTSVNGVTRQGGAAITIATNTVTGYAPVQAGGVTRRVARLSGRLKVVVGGNFTSMNGSSNPGYGLARLNPATGGNLPLPVNTVIRNAGTNSAIYDLAGNATASTAPDTSSASRRQPRGRLQGRLERRLSVGRGLPRRQLLGLPVR